MATEEKSYNLLHYPFEKSPNAQWLRSRVRILNYTIHRNSGVFVDKFDGEAQLAPTLKWFPQLYELRLGIDNMFKLNDKTIAALQDTPSIRALQIAMRMDRTGTRPGQSQVPYQILGISAWKLEFLVIRGDLFDIKVWDSYPPVAHKLVEFRWTVQNCNRTLHAPDVEKLITWITGNSINTLENLHLPYDHPLVQKLAHRIRSLRIPTLMETPKNFINLRELILTEEMPQVPPEYPYYVSLPPNLTHFGIRVQNVPERSLVDDIVNHGFNPKLKSFTIYHQIVPTFPRQTPGLTDRESWYPTDTDVLVRRFASEHWIQVGMRSDLVQSSEYPRGVTIENMHKRNHVVGVDHTEDSSTQNPKSLFDFGTVIRKQFAGSINRQEKEPSDSFERIREVA
jgi:hypothetical protein